MTTTTDLIKLRKLAEAAAISTFNDYNYSKFADAADPAKVIELLDTIEAKAKQVETLQADAERYIVWMWRLRQRAYVLSDA